MIIQIRGTSGSGKTTAMRKIMKEHPASVLPMRVEGRRNPLYYQLVGTAWQFPVWVIGSYESTCGGCDTIHGYEELQRVVRERLEVGGHVLMEGLLLSEDSKQTILMSKTVIGHRWLPGVRCIFLTTPIELCLERIRGRREARGNDKPLNENNTRNRVATIARARAKLEAAGIYCRSASADQAPRLILSWLKEG